MAEIRLGARLKAARARRGLSLRSLGKKTGFSASFLSQVELDQTSPSLASLARLASGLGVGLAALIADEKAPAADATVMRAKDRKGLRSEWSKASVSSLLPPGADDRLSVMLIELQPHGRSGNPGDTVTGREIAFCVRGRALLQVGDLTQRLAAGDSAHYDASAGPRWSNPGRSRCQILIINVRGR